MKLPYTYPSAGKACRRMLALLLALLLLPATMSAQKSYRYFSLVNNLEAEYQLPAVGTVVKFKDGQVVATNGEQTVTLPQAEMKRMFFTNTVTAIKAPELQPGDGKAVVYNLQGMRVGEGKDLDAIRAKLRKGVYLIIYNGKSWKEVIK